VHTGMGNSCSNTHEDRLLHECFMLDMYKDEYLKKTNSEYDYKHIRVPSGFILKIFNIFGQHWFIPTFYISKVKISNMFIQKTTNQEDAW
jgi:hypothetical protein